MSDTVIMYLIVGAFSLTVVGILASMVIQKMKGKITIFPNPVSLEDDDITGEVYLMTKQAIQSDGFKLTLTGTRVYYDYDNNRETDIIHTSSVWLAKREEYGASENNTYEFVMPIPILGNNEGRPQTGNESVDKMLDMAGDFLSRMDDEHIEWELKAVLDVPGIDLSARININL